MIKISHPTVWVTWPPQSVCLWPSILRWTLLACYWMNPFSSLGPRVASSSFGKDHPTWTVRNTSLSWGLQNPQSPSWANFFLIVSQSGLCLFYCSSSSGTEFSTPWSLYISCRDHRVPSRKVAFRTPFHKEWYPMTRYRLQARTLCLR